MTRKNIFLIFLGFILGATSVIGYIWVRYSAGGFWDVVRIPSNMQTATREYPRAEKPGLVKVVAPRINEIIISPLVIIGEARGYWFFEASFPIRLFDGNGREMGVAIAQAQSEWMTESFVPFEARLEFSTPQTREGTLVLEKDNPSGLPEHADELRIPVRFR